MIAPSDLAVVVLAGGEGRRIGGDKPLRRLGGEALIDRALRRARRWSPHVAVAIRAEAQAGAADAVFLRDDPAIEGPLAGLAAALRYAKQEERPALLTLPCDAPFLPDDLASRLIAGIGDAAVAVAASGGRLHPTCALWKGATLAGLAAYVAGGHRSLRGFAAGIGLRAVEWPTGPIDPFFNVNTAEDLAQAEARLSGC